MEENVSFTVEYRLYEYLALIRSHALATAIPEGASQLQRLITKLLVAVVGRAMFYIKSHRIGACDFVIDKSGIARNSKQGQTIVPWSKVTALHTYDTGYIIEVKPGGMPVPFRALSQDQRDKIAYLFATYAHTGGATY